MRTGRYCFKTRYTQRKWFTPPRAVQVLMVEVDEPIANGCRAVLWREATETDARDYEAAQTRLRVEFENASGERGRLRGRLDAIAETARRL